MTTFFENNFTFHVAKITARFFRRISPKLNFTFHVAKNYCAFFRRIFSKLNFAFYVSLLAEPQVQARELDVPARFCFC